MKKRHFILLMAAIGFLPAEAQDGTLPMLEEGRVWNDVALHPGVNTEYTNFFGMPCEGIPHQYVIRGDSVVNGKTYKKLCREDWALPMLMRQEGSRIYKWISNSTEELAYDFGCEERDTIYFDDLAVLVVDKVDVVRVNGTDRRRLKINWISGFYEDELFVDIWIEGIGGATTSPCLFNSWASSSSGMMQSCIQDGEVLFSWDDFFKDGYTNSVSDFRIPNSELRSEVYDLQGHRIDSLSHRGLYIRDGRKVVRR